MKRLLELLVVVGVAAGTSSCTSQGSSSQSESPLGAARENLAADLRQCTQTYGYDPGNTPNLAENQLAPRELEWRQCAYDAVRTYAGSHPTLSGRYEQLINEDITMTNAVQSGAMTRSQRRQRIQTLVEQIKSAEEDQARAEAMDQARQTEQVRQVVDGMRGFY